MNIYVNENIKRLRKEKDITQETLADFLGISFQSVSKWERNESLPDITLVPAIANYFGVTIDELMGNDKIRAEEQIQKYFADYKKASMSAKTEKDCIPIAKQAYRDYPYDYRVMMFYASALIYNSSYSVSEREEIKRLCNLVLDGCTDDKLRQEALHWLFNATVDKDEKLKILGRMYNLDEPSLDCKEMLLSIYPIETEKGMELTQDIIRDKWWYLNNYLYNYGNLFNENNEKYSVDSETRIKIIKKCMGIFYALFDEDDLGEYLFYEGQYNEFLAVEYAKLGETEKALDHFEKSVDGWIKYNNLPERYEYKSILMNRIVFDRTKIFQGGEYPYLTRYIDTIDKMSAYDIIRDNPRFKAAYDKLKNYKK